AEDGIQDLTVTGVQTCALPISLMQFHGNPIARDEDPMWIWRIKSQGNEEARQQFLEGYVPQIRELGLTVPDPSLRRTDDGVWERSEERRVGKEGGLGWGGR